MGVLLLPTTKSNLGHGIKPANTVHLYSYIACFIYEKLNKLCDSATEYKTTKMKLDSEWGMHQSRIFFVRTLVWYNKMSSWFFGKWPSAVSIVVQYAKCCSVEGILNNKSLLDWNLCTFDTWLRSTVDEYCSTSKMVIKLDLMFGWLSKNWFLVYCLHSRDDTVL
jgi:hypothetical protein